VFADSKNICVLGNTGGGRDAWKRPAMAAIAEAHCEHMILTNEDPYDEDPQKIIDEMAAGVKNAKKLHVIPDRREAIREAIASAVWLHTQHPKTRIAVLITGKGTDPYIMGPRGAKKPWDDATVVREELKKLLH
jgi:UDP-N-acetylmuramoyl-L-alanyl-D-glutamate--2,6-diaminopimelate ligase